MKRWLSIAAVVLSLALLLAACGTVDVTGTWTQEGGTVSLTFNEDGSGRMVQDGKTTHTFTYKVSGKRLKMDGADGKFEYFCELSEDAADTLTLTGSEGQVVTLVRAEA